MCKVLRIAHYEYYYQRKKKENRYKEANEKLDKEILKEYENSKGGYGSPKIQKALEKRGIRASQKRVARRMKKIGLKSIIVKKYRTSGSKGKVDDTNKPNLLAHNPKVVSSSLTPATNSYITRTVTVLVIFYCLKIVCNNALK